MLKKKLTELEKQLMERIERNIKLEGIITNLEKEKEKEKEPVVIKTINSTTNPEVEK